MTSGYRGFDDPKKLHNCVEKLGMIALRDRLKKAPASHIRIFVLKRQIINDT
jgi:hypothetical protein